MTTEDWSIPDTVNRTDTARATSARTIRGVDAVARINNSMSAAMAVDLYRTPMRLSGTANVSAIANAAVPSKIVLSARAHTRPLTGTRKYVDSPRSPVTAPKSHRKYRIGSG